MKHALLLITLFTLCACAQNQSIFNDMAGGAGRNAGHFQPQN